MPVKNGYYTDLGKFSLDKFEKILNKNDIIPSRRVLKEDTHNKFEALKKNGIKSLGDIKKALSTRQKLFEFSVKTGLEDMYLAILLREVNSYEPAPILLFDFPGISNRAADSLSSEGIKNTMHLFPHVLNKEKRLDFSNKTGIDYKDILDFARLTDLSRVKWVGPVFARMFILAGAGSAELLSKANSGELYEKLNLIKTEKHFTRAKFLESDIALTIAASADVPKVMDFSED